MNIIGKIILIFGTISVGALLIFASFLGAEEIQMDQMVFPEEYLGTFELLEKDTNNFFIGEIDSTGELEAGDEKVFIEKVSNISRFFSNNKITEVIVGRKGEESKINIEPHVYLNIQPGIYIFDMNEINKNFVVDGGMFHIENKGPGSFIVNNINPNQTMIFSLDTIINLTLTSKQQELTSILLYPHSYIIFNQKRNLLVRNGDLLKISSIFTLDFFGEKIFSKSGEINREFIELITLKNTQLVGFVEKTFSFLLSEQSEIQEIFQPYVQKNFLSTPGEKFITQYFGWLLNEEKRKLYYKNIIIREIVHLFHETQDNKEKRKNIIENMKKLQEMSLEEEKDMKRLIYFYYRNNLISTNPSLYAAINFSQLIHELKNGEMSINKIEALLFLKNIFKKYDFQEKSSVLKEVSSFKEKYIGNTLNYEKISGEYQEIEYLLFFAEKILTTDFIDANNHINEISLLLEDYTSISTKFYQSTKASVIKTGLFKNARVSEKIYQTLKSTYFKEERNTQNLLERKDSLSGENRINRESTARIETSISFLQEFYSNNIAFLDETNSNDLSIKQSYTRQKEMFKEIFEALGDYEKYKSKYDTQKSIFLGGSSIISGQNQNTLLTNEKADTYLRQFYGVSSNPIAIDIKSYDYCIDPYSNTENQDEAPYCYEIDGLNVNGNTLSFLLFPYEKNEISDIKVNGIQRAGSYKLDDIEEELGERLKKASKREDQIRYDFRNFLVATFVTQSQKSSNEIYEEEDDILEEDKVIKSFKRNKLLGESGDFSILQGFLDIKYNDLIVTPDYEISIKTSTFNAGIDVCENRNCDTNVKQFVGNLESQYEFTNSHSFKDITIKLQEENNTQKYRFGGNSIEVIGDIQVDKLEGEIKILLSYAKDIETIQESLKNNLKINDIKIKYYTYSKRGEVVGKYKGKDLNIYIESGGNINVYYDSERQQNQTLPISELESILEIIS